MLNHFNLDHVLTTYFPSIAFNYILKSPTSSTRSPYSFGFSTSIDWCFIIFCVWYKQNNIISYYFTAMDTIKFTQYMLKAVEIYFCRKCIYVISGPSWLAQFLTHYMWGVHCVSLDQGTSYLDWIFCCFPHYCQMNVGRICWNRPLLLAPKSFQVHCSNDHGISFHNTSAVIWS
jgi:hypothetical protein